MPRVGAVVGALLCFVPVAGFTAIAPGLPQEGTVEEARFEEERFPIRAFVVEGNESVATDVLVDALAAWVGEHQPASALLQARDAVLRVYRGAGYEMVSVQLPSRIGIDGVVRLRVRETAIGRVAVSGNRHYPEDHFRAVLPSLREGRSPDLGALARELFLANDHPAYRVTLAFTPAANGDADVEVKVVDSDPVRVALSADNTGTRETGRGRATITASHANLWGKGHEGAVGYTTSPQFPSRVQQLVLSYQVTLPTLASRLQVGASYSSANAGRIAEVFDVAGQGSTFSLRLQRDLLRSDTARQVLEFGLDAKRYRNTIDFFGENLGVDVDARPVSLTYMASLRQGGTSASASLGYTRNLPGGARNDDATYRASRAGAKAAWDAWRGRLEVSSALAAQWTWHGRLDAQYAKQPLISGEQFGVGGARSVRGFEERETSGDRGWSVSGELLSPPFAGQHRLLAFVDAGGHDRLNLLPGEPGGTSLVSYGFGWRWAVGASLAASLDVARVVRGTPTTPAGSHGLHLSASWRPR